MENLISYTSNIEAHVIRLLPDSDLYCELVNYMTARNIYAAFIMTCVGSLKKFHIRTATGFEYLIKEGNFEIVSLVGCVSIERSHVHICLSDKNGNSIGGHLMQEGNIVFTTAEIVLGVLPALNFSSEICKKSGWDELKISKKD